MSLFYSKNFSPQGMNFFHFKNAEFDKAFEKAQKVNDGEEKIKLYQKMDSLVTDEAPFIPLFYDQVVRLVNHHIQGLHTNPMNLLSLKYVTKEITSKK